MIEMSLITGREETRCFGLLALQSDRTSSTTSACHLKVTQAFVLCNCSFQNISERGSPRYRVEDKGTGA